MATKLAIKHCPGGSLVARQDYIISQGAGSIWMSGALNRALNSAWFYKKVASNYHEVLSISYTPVRVQYLNYYPSLRQSQGCG